MLIRVWSIRRIGSRRTDLPNVTSPRCQYRHHAYSGLEALSPFRLRNSIYLSITTRRPSQNSNFPIFSHIVRTPPLIQHPWHYDRLKRVAYADPSSAAHNRLVQEWQQRILYRKELSSSFSRLHELHRPFIHTCPRFFHVCYARLAHEYRHHVHFRARQPGCHVAPCRWLHTPHNVRTAW